MMSCLDSFCSRDRAASDKKVKGTYESPNGRNLNTGNSFGRNDIETAKRESQQTEATHDRNQSIPTIHSAESLTNPKLRIQLNTKSINGKQLNSPSKFINV